MTFKEIRDRIQSLLIFGGWTNTAIKPDYAYLANMGLKLFTQESQHCVETLSLLTVSDQDKYAVNPYPDDLIDWIALFNTAQYSTDNLSFSWLPQTSLANLDNADRLWRNTPAGFPIKWFWYDPKHIGLWPSPSADGISVTWLGLRHEPRMVNDTDTPLVPSMDCEGICLLGAWYHGKLYARGEEIRTVTNYREEGLAFAYRTKEIMSAKNAEMVTRYVSRAPQEYMVGGAKQIPFFGFARQ